MADLAKIGDLLAGMGAGFSGQLPQYQYAKQQAQEAAFLADERRRKALIRDFAVAYQMGANGAWDSADKFLGSRSEFIKKLGGDSYHTDGIQAMMRDPAQREAALKELEPYALAYSMEQRGQGANQKGQTFAMTNPETGQIEMVGSVFDPASGQWTAQRVPVGGGEIVGPSGVAPSQRPNQRYAETAAEQSARLGYAAPIAGAQAQARADVEAATAPQIAADTTAAQEEAKANVERKIAQRGNATAFDAYQQAMNGIRTSFGKTDTGPIAGRMPAVTAGQQTAEGAIAAAAPVLKQLFRSAGEGVFTDKDQQLLIDMLPKRTDHPEVVESKLGMIDSVVAAKLNMSGAPAQPVPRETPKRRATDTPNVVNWNDL